jgi:integrase
VDLLDFQKFLAVHYVPIVANRYVGLLIQVLELAEDSLPGFRSPHHNRNFKTLPVGASKPLDLPSEEQFRAVLAFIHAESGNPDRESSADLAEGLAYSNLRIAEARRLRVVHVDLKAGCLTLPAEIVKGKKKGRTVPLGASALALYTRLAKAAGAEGIIFKTHSCIFALKRACESVGCQRLTHHKLRHWWATIALEKAGDVKQVAEWLGHRDGGKLVLATYTHTRDEREKALAAKLDFNWSAVVE